MSEPSIAMSSMVYIIDDRGCTSAGNFVDNENNIEVKFVLELLRELTL
jgi:hypothetical protein